MVIVQFPTCRIARMPSGALGIMPQVEADFVTRHRFGGADGAPFMERIDRRIDALPGLAGLHLITGTVGEAGGRPRLRHGRSAAA